MMDCIIIVCATLFFLFLLRFAYWTGKVITIAQHKAQLRRIAMADDMIKARLSDEEANDCVARYRAMLAEKAPSRITYPYM